MRQRALLAAVVAVLLSLAACPVVDAQKLVVVDQASTLRSSARRSGRRGPVPAPEGVTSAAVGDDAVQVPDNPAPVDVQPTCEQTSCLFSAGG